MFVTMLFSVLNLSGTTFLKQHRLCILDFSTKYKKHAFLSCKIDIILSYSYSVNIEWLWTSDSVVGPS